MNDWYKDAIIYSLHVGTFHDGNGDGVGDFEGLTQKLDCLERDVTLPDRDGLRLPMRWEEVAQQELHPVRDRAEGGESLLASIRKMIATRREHLAFGRGSVSFLDALDLQMELEGHEWTWFFRPGRVL